jgi:hypothetical protein
LRNPLQQRAHENRSAGESQSLAIDPIVASLWPQIRGERQVVAGALRVSNLGEGTAEAEVREVVDWVALDHGCKLLSGS